MYYDELQRIIDLARWLQRHPVPQDAVTCQLLRMRLGYAEHELGAMQGLVATELWCGAEDDPLRKGRPMA